MQNVIIGYLTQWRTGQHNIKFHVSTHFITFQPYLGIMKVKFITLQKMTRDLFKYFSREATRGRLYRDILNPAKRTQHALGISNRKFLRWTSITGVKEIKRGRKERFDSFDKDVVRRQILKMLDEQELLTLKKLKAQLQEHRDLDISKSSLWKIVRSLGFTFKKRTGGKNVVCEKTHLVSARSKYLRQVREKREEGYDIVYLDETWINAHHTKEREWQSTDGSRIRHVPPSKGQRLIIAHAGSRRYGLIPDADLIFVGKSKDNRDYHTEMNGQCFAEWMEHSLLPSLDHPSCIVMDNASYHNFVSPEDKIPTSASTKEEIRTWLQKENIQHSDRHLKPELLSMVKQRKTTKTYHIDKLIEKYGHTSLRLPPYHSHLNPIELVWAKIKGEVATNNRSFKLSEVKILARNALSSVDKCFWQKCEDHVLREEETYWQKEGLAIIQPDMIISLASSDSDDD